MHQPMTRRKEALTCNPECGSNPNMDREETPRLPDRLEVAKLVHALVKRLRRKLGDDPAKPAFILNKRGVGYLLPGPDDP